MDNQYVIATCVIGVAIVTFLIQNNIFAKPADLLKLKDQIFKESDNKYADSKTVSALEKTVENGFKEVQGKQDKLEVKQDKMYDLLVELMVDSAKGNKAKYNNDRGED